jgi:hypothetical protein
MENPLDDGRLLDARDHPKLAAAARVSMSMPKTAGRCDRHQPMLVGRRLRQLSVLAI